MSERRDPVTETGKYWLRNSKEQHKAGNMADALGCLQQAYNHLENAAFHEAEQADKLRLAMAKIRDHIKDYGGDDCDVDFIIRVITEAS